MTDEQLAEACANGDHLAQKKLFDKYAGKMMGVCLRYANNAAEAQDILQDGFVKVFQHMSGYNGSGSLEGWVRRIIVNTALDDFRKRKKERESKVDFEDVAYGITDESTVLDELAARDLLGIIQEIPQGYRTVFNLFAIEGFNHKEIADRLGISESTSKTQYRKAKLYIQKIITLRQQNSE